MPFQGARGRKVADRKRRIRAFVRGGVQGVGFRPFVYDLAVRYGLNGYVLNSPDGAELEIEGRAEDVAALLSDLQQGVPFPGFVSSLRTETVPLQHSDGFEIRESREGGTVSAVVLPDIATCPLCIAELLDPNDRRFRYPFINCTHCGPRYTIIEALPYDRPNTSMAGFPMCPECLREYEDPRDRRFHAQPIACPKCGPQVELWNPNGDVLAPAQTAIPAAARVLSEGGILAVKGIGGFHLFVDARNEDAVQRLRSRKRREAKPLAVMVPDLSTASALAEISREEEDLLTGYEAPIVLLKRRPGGLAESVAPDLRDLGLMLPYSPLHHLLMRDCGFPVVATSGNLSDEPICSDETSALDTFRDIADALLVHDRPIVRSIDDSVARVIDRHPVLYRRARGYAPMPTPLPGGNRGFLAVGGHLKNTIALGLGDSAVLFPHVGDLEHPGSRARAAGHVADVQALYREQANTAVCDLHPDYASTASALQLGVPMIGVQHHVAHAAGVLVETESPLPSLAVVFDGTGYGLDRSIWGGEFLRVDEGGFERVGHLRRFPLVGGDAAARDGRRPALGLLSEVPSVAELPAFRAWLETAFRPDRLALLRSAIASGTNVVGTSSAGRLFDAVAALGAGLLHSRYESEAAMRFEALANPRSEGEYRFVLRERDDGFEVDWQPVLEDLAQDLDRRSDPSAISARFHRGLAQSIVAAARRVGLPCVALSGGCFQNRLLVEEACRLLRGVGFEVRLHRRIPPNDGGLAFGQLAAVALGLGQRCA